MKHILVIGCGHLMNSLLLAQKRATVKSSFPKNFQYTLVNRTHQKAIDLAQSLAQAPTSLKVETVQSIQLNQLDVAAFDALLLGVKPTQLADLVLQHPILKTFEGEVISTLAAIDLATLKTFFSASKIVTRIMPSITVSEISSKALFLSSDHQSSILTDWYQEPIGNLFNVNSDQELDQWTLLFGSNAAYTAALIKPWVEFLSQTKSTSLNKTHDVQMTMIDQFIVALEFLKNKNLVEIINKVQTPGGITAQALQILEQRQYASMVEMALQAAYQRSQEVKKLSLS